MTHDEKNSQKDEYMKDLEYLNDILMNSNVEISEIYEKMDEIHEKLKNIE